jgi:2-polyprenyl-3-methyl-5-hydroxy-6-metoxy-1,4-benzoquinol methylase
MFPDFSKRSDDIEIMDDLNCSGEVVRQTLRELEFINTWLGGNAVTLNGLRKLLKITNTNAQQHKLRVTDLGCGGGDILELLSRNFNKRGIKAHLEGIDANPNIIACATANSSSALGITYKTQDILSEPFTRKQHDIVFATLFFHHFTSDQLVEVFSSLKKQVTIGIVINDLHRHWLAYYSIKLLTKFFSKSSMVKYDAPLSVLRGFRKAELMEILQKAGIENYSLKWKWAFRWQLVIHNSSDR